MRLFADECLYLMTTMFLRKQGHDILTIQEAGFSGVKNGEVAKLANKEKRILITRDMHFCNILKFPPENNNGIIVLKIRPDNTSLVHNNLLNFLKKYTKEKIAQTLVIIDHNKFRIRR
jgi:predicted nuclease of predicted toxin-antitoxin system